ncbi:winged helix domain-containing protein [Alsobacter sp. R-9]
MDDVVKLRFRIDGGDVKEASGRLAWCLAQLVLAGERGVTPIERPAPRWSGYVDQLRDRYGLCIETIMEPHGGPYSGRHGRYVLRSRVEIIDVVRRAA